MQIPVKLSYDLWTKVNLQRFKDSLVIVSFFSDTIMTKKPINTDNERVKYSIIFKFISY